MFGYVKIRKSDLLVRDYEIYKGVYCSLCKQLGREYGQLSRLTLNYDFALLALLKLSLSDDCPGFSKGRCSFNPFVRCNCCKNGEKQLSFAAAAAMIMCYCKVKDNVADGSLPKKLLYGALLPYFKLKMRRAAKKYPEVRDIIFNAMAEQSRAEKTPCCSLDAAADPSAKALGELAAFGEEDARQAEVLKRLGYLIGRWVYIADALDDLEDDRKHDSFNPLAGDKRAANEVAANARGLLLVTLGEVAGAFELLRVKRFRSILHNIVYDGMYDTVESISKKEEGN